MARFAIVSLTRAVRFPGLGMGRKTILRSSVDAGLSMDQRSFRVLSTTYSRTQPDTCRHHRVTESTESEG